MYCKICGFELERDDSLCPNCGSPVERRKRNPFLISLLLVIALILPLTACGDKKGNTIKTIPISESITIEGWSIAVKDYSFTLDQIFPHSHYPQLTENEKWFIVNIIFTNNTGNSRLLYELEDIIGFGVLDGYEITADLSGSKYDYAIGVFGSDFNSLYIIRKEKSVECTFYFTVPLQVVEDDSVLLSIESHINWQLC